MAKEDNTEDPKDPDLPEKPPKIQTTAIVLAAIIGGVAGYLICHFTADDSAAKQDIQIEQETDNQG